MFICWSQVLSKSAKARPRSAKNHMRSDCCTIAVIRPPACIHFIFSCCYYCCGLILQCSSTSQVISITFYSEHEKSDKFCSEALISAWGSFTCRKSTTQDQWLYFPSEGSHTQDFYALKKPLTLAGFEPANLESSGEYDNHWTTGDNSCLVMSTFSYSKGSAVYHTFRVQQCVH